MKVKHNFFTSTRVYGKYKMIMTQHMFSSIGVKKYGAVNWVIMLNNEHIVLNTYIKKTHIKINEDFMDEHWNKFIVDYGENLDIWSINGTQTLQEFNDYDKKLLSKQLTTKEIDDALAAASAEKNNREHTLRMVKKMNDKIKLICEEIDRLK